MNNRLPKMRRSLDDLMQQELADYCKKLMSNRGFTKEFAIKWCADRFDDRGSLAVHEYVTEMEVVDKITGEIEPLVIKPGLVLEIDHDKLETFIAHLIMENLFNLAENATSFAVMAADSGAYVVWKMCNMIPDVPPEDQLKVSYGAVFGSKDTALVDGECKSQAYAYPLLMTSMKAMIAGGALVPRGELIS